MSRKPAETRAETTALAVPDYGVVVRGLAPGMHDFLELLPRAAESPALRRVAPDPDLRDRLLRGARVRLEEMRGYCWVDDDVPCVVLSLAYYRNGGDLDLYLDLLHELTHLRQVAEGRDVWDERLPYVDRPTEIEGYAVAIEEGRRLGMSEADVVRHLSNPWMTADDVTPLLAVGAAAPRR
jgi:hypothetical protein